MPSLKLMLTMDIMDMLDMLDMGMPLTLTATDTEPTDLRIRIQIWSLLGLKTRQTKGTILDWLNFPVSWYFLAKIGMGISNKVTKQNNVFLFMK